VDHLAPQTHDEWTPIRDLWCVGVLDRTVEELATAYGWSWDQAEVDGLGLMFYMPLAWDGKSRFLLSVSATYPESGIAIEVARGENPAAARSDLLNALGLLSSALLAISEGESWFARWDPPHNAGDRPATAKPR
jgi:hypothetical protein